MVSTKLTGEEYHVCIIGSGPAGVILALELSKKNPNKKILLLEYGTKDQPSRNGLDDSIMVNNTVNHHPPYECTNKGLGGTTATWGGRCVMYDEVDFIDRPIVAGGCTWRQDLYDEIKKYVAPAADYFECGKPVFDLNELPEYRKRRISENFVEEDVTDSVLERWSMPTRFGSRYENEIGQNRSITFVEGVEARFFSAPNDKGKIESLQVRFTANKDLVEIRARHFVLAAGTQETTRLLLRNKQIFEKIGGPSPALGRYYQGHLSGKIASVKFTGDPRKTDYGFLRDSDGVYLRRRFQFSKKLLVEKNLLNTAIWLDNPLYFDPKHKSGPMSFMYLAMVTPFLGKKLAPPAIAHSITKGKITGIGKHAMNILRGLPGSIMTPASIFFRRYCLTRKLPGVFLYSPDNTYALHFHAEQIPDSSNRMELALDGETLNIHYDLSENDIQSVVRLHEVLDEHLQRTSSGKLDYWFPKSKLSEAIRTISKDGIHQSGTTRIADSPQQGVVDHDLRVWGTENIFVCSSSVFPTSGQANPTFLIGAFAVRLAAYLNTIDENNSTR